MTIIHMGISPLLAYQTSTDPSDFSVMFKFRADVSEEHKATFVRELKQLKNLPCVKDHHLIVGGNSITDPIERSKGFQYALVSYHQDRKALEEYQASKEHHWCVGPVSVIFDVLRFQQGYKHIPISFQRRSLQV
jgi:hypothetical protein